MSKKDKRITYKRKKISEFRKLDSKRAKQFNVNSDNDCVHPDYIYERDGSDYYYLSMTHKPPKGKEQDYMRLERSVDPKDKRAAYINTKSGHADYHAFGARYKDYSFSDGDKKRVDNIIKKNKKRK